VYQQFTDTSIKKQVLKNLYADVRALILKKRDALHYHIILGTFAKIATVIKAPTGVDYLPIHLPQVPLFQRSVLPAPSPTGEKMQRISFFKIKARTIG